MNLKKVCGLLIPINFWFILLDDVTYRCVFILTYKILMTLLNELDITKLLKYQIPTTLSSSHSTCPIWAAHPQE